MHVCTVHRAFYYHGKDYLATLLFPDVCAPLNEPSNISNLDFSITVRQERLSMLSYAPIEIAESVKTPITIELRSYGL